MSKNYKKNEKEGILEDKKLRTIFVSGLPYTTNE
jgi:hypothetical protein